MFRGDNAHSLSYEQQAKFIQDRISNVEKNFGELCVGFGDYTRKTARLRDMGDELAKVIKEYANNEIVNKSLSAGLDNLSITLTAIEEYRNCEVQRLEAKYEEYFPFRGHYKIPLCIVDKKKLCRWAQAIGSKITHRCKSPNLESNQELSLKRAPHISHDCSRKDNHNIFIHTNLIKTKVIGELCQYESICKHAREELKHTMNVREKEMARKKVLDKARERQPFNRQQITYAESELLKASAEMSRSAKGLSEQTEFFEKRKLVQLKTLLLDFVRIEMTFHAKAVELLSVAFQQIADINDRADLELLVTGLSNEEDESNFKRKLRSPEKQVSTGISVRSSSLASLMNPHQSPARGDEDSMSLGRLRSPDKNLSAKSRTSSLAALMNHSSSKDEEETTDSEGSRDNSTSEETESR